MMFIKLWLQVLSRIRYVRNVRSIRWEQVIQNYLKLFIKWKDIDSVSTLYFNPNVPQNKIIWVYWKQGMDNAPKMIKKCVNSVKDHCGNYEIIFLSEKNIREYVQLPSHIEKIYKAGKMKEAHHSDIIRLVLLIKYGGVWCDSTCYFSDEIPEYLRKSDFFMFSRDLLSGNVFPIICSNWFIMSKPNNKILSQTFNYLMEYYRHYNKPIDYFIFHHVLSIIVRKDAECRRIWDEKPYICNMNPHVLFFSFDRTYREDDYKHILSSCFVHKLTYKFDKGLLEKKSEENVLSHFISSVD